MDRSVILERLRQAERHVVQGEHHIARQKGIVVRLTMDDLYEHAKAARALLLQFEEMQALHIANRDRLRATLAEESSPFGHAR
jgi:hypothetical protein